MLFQFISPERIDNFSANLIVTRSRIDTSKTKMGDLQNIEKQTIHMQARTFPIFKVIDKKEQQVGKTNGFWMIASYAFGELDLVSYQHIFMDANNYLVSVVYTCLLGQIDKMKSEFDKSLKTLKLDEENKEAIK